MEAAEVQGKDVCVECLTKMHDEVELQYRRIVKHEVPSRRGGFRQLGEIDS